MTYGLPASLDVFIVVVMFIYKISWLLKVYVELLLRIKSPLYSIFVIALSANLPVPLFPVYVDKYNFTEFHLTVLFALYGVFLFASLVFSSSLVEKLGTELVVLVSLAISIMGTLLFISSSSAEMLFSARCLTGFSVGLFMGAGNSLLMKRAGERAPRAAFLSSMLTMFGFGSGPLLSGLLVQYLPLDAERSAYLILLICLFMALFIHVKTTDRIQFLPSDDPLRLHIRLGVPVCHLKHFLLFVAPSIFLMFSLNATIISLLPSFVREIIRSTNLAWSGILLFVLLGGGALAQQLPWLKSKVQRARFGVLTLPIGAWLVLFSGQIQSISLLFVGIVIQAIGSGWTFQGSFLLASAMANKVDRARVISTYYVSAYLGMVFPPVLIGALSQYSGLFESLVLLVAMETTLAIMLLYSSNILNFNRYGGD